MIRSSTLRLAAVCGLVLVAFSARALTLDTQSLWRDEVDALCYAYQFPHLVAAAIAPDPEYRLTTPSACPLETATAAPGGDAVSRLLATLSRMTRHNGPLYYFVLRGWVALAGVSAYAMRFLSLMLGVLCVPLAYATGRRLIGRQAGFLAALVMAISPYVVWYGQEVKMYSLVPALALSAVYSLRRACEGGGRRWWAVQIVSTSLAFYCHIFAALLIPVQILLYLCWWPVSRRCWRGALVSLACLTLPYLPLVVWQLPSALRARETGFPARGLVEMAEILLNGWNLGILPRGWPWGLLLGGGLAGWGLISPAFVPSSPERGERRVGPWRTRLAIVCWMVAPLLAIWLISLRQPLFTDRYLIWSAPAFYLLVVLGLTSIWRLAPLRLRGRRLPIGRRVAVVLLAGTVLVAAVNLYWQAKTTIKSDSRAAAAYVGERIEPGGLIIFQIPHSRYTFDYYYEGEDYEWADGLYTNWLASDGSYLLSQEQAFWSMRAIVFGHDTVWLVLSEESMWDERGLVRGWLEDTASLLEEARFVHVSVHRFQIPDQPADP
ncbi:MAG: phospholipid carrier-dependent glycosyltransferase [Anaerolineales bacterium]|nr:MAG: phospholipid carrier-dependent glycosyltransferase [Anaerolineales bacterium]